MNTKTKTSRMAHVRVSKRSGSVAGTTRISLDRLAAPHTRSCPPPWKPGVWTQVFSPAECWRIRSTTIFE
jgi:hypothetical protein